MEKEMARHWMGLMTLSWLYKMSWLLISHLPLFPTNGKLWELSDSTVIPGPCALAYLPYRAQESRTPTSQPPMQLRISMDIAALLWLWDKDLNGQRDGGLVISNTSSHLVLDFLVCMKHKPLIQATVGQAFCLQAAGLRKWKWNFCYVSNWNSFSAVLG